MEVISLVVTAITSVPSMILFVLKCNILMSILYFSNFRATLYLLVPWMIYKRTWPKHLQLTQC